MAKSRPSTSGSYHDDAPGQHHPHGAGRLHAHGDSRRLRIALAITGALLVAEVAGGLLSNSLALLADAGHMLTDAGALSLSLFVAWFARQAHPPGKTYGYLRWEILAAFLNGATLLLLSGWILWESVARLRAPEPVTGGLMLGVAAAGLAANIVAARVLHPSSGSSLNVRGAYLHVVSDLLASVGTVSAAIVIWATGWLAADPIASMLTTALIVRGAWRLVRESVDVLLESAPAHCPPVDIRAKLEAIPGIESIHDLHIWTVTSGMVALSAHAIVRDAGRHQQVLEAVHAVVRPFGIGHVTVQLERQDMHAHDSHQLHD